MLYVAMILSLEFGLGSGVLSNCDKSEESVLKIFRLRLKVPSFKRDKPTPI